MRTVVSFTGVTQSKHSSLPSLHAKVCLSGDFQCNANELLFLILVLPSTYILNDKFRSEIWA